MKSASGPRAALRLAGRLVPSSLSGKALIAGTSVTILAVAAAFVVLSLELRRQSRGHLVDLLRENQTTVRNLQARTSEELLWTSRLVSLSPTLRAAIETYRAEAGADGSVRSDLVETIRVELDRIREMLGRDLILLTDEEGALLAASVSPDSGIDPDATAGELPGAKRPLTAASGAAPSFSLLRSAAGTFQAGAVPIVLQGYPIGTLTVADRLDSASLRRLGESLHCEVLLLADGRVLDSTFKGNRRAILPEGIANEISGAAQDSEPVRVGGDEYVTATLPLGEDEAGRPATLVLMRSLTRSLSPANRSLAITMLVCGSVAVILSGAAAWGVSRSALSPLERFVRFMESAAADKDKSRRYDGPTESAEIRVLDRAYSHLMSALQEREEQLLLHAREEMVRVERLKETEKLASLGRMLSGAAHEINNPLTGVVGNVDLLVMSDRFEGKDREMLERVRREARRISALVRSLLKAAHRDTGERTLVDLCQILRETVALREHDFMRAGITLSLEAPPEPIRLSANELEIQQVFLNIINNAFDALTDHPAPGAHREVALRASRQEEQAVITIADNGPGMKDPHRVFDHFYTTKPVGKGTGLGLSISHAGVTGHGGTIAASNRPGGGACFTITLPLAPPAGASTAGIGASRAGTPAAAGPAPDAGSPGGGARGARILLVEDEPGILQVQQTLLESMGAMAVGARTGEEARDWLEKREPDLVVCDLVLPGELSGQSLFHWVQANRPAWSGRFVFVTGDTASESTRSFLESTRCPHLMKPFTAEEYAQLIRGAIAALRVAA